MRLEIQKGSLHQILMLCVYASSITCHRCSNVSSLALDTYSRTYLQLPTAVLREAPPLVPLRQSLTANYIILS